MAPFSAPSERESPVQFPTRDRRRLIWGKIPDARAAMDLMNRSWTENQDRPLKFEEEFIRGYLQYPSTAPVLSPALYDGESLVGFVIGIPRHVMLHDRECDLVLLTFFTVAPDFKGCGLGVAIWAECLRSAQQAGYDGAIHYCSEGNRSNHVTAAAAHRIGLVQHPIGKVEFLMASLASIGKEQATPATPSIDRFMAAASSPPPTPLARLWSRTEGEWECIHRAGALYTTSDDPDPPAALAGYRIDIMDGLGTRCLFIDDVLWRDVPPSSRVELLRRFVAAASDCKVAFVPLLNYADMSAFRAVGFRRSPKSLAAYVTIWNGNPCPDIPSMYIDVI